MLFVTGSDAPLYHYPITTVSLIAVNLLIHLGLTPIEPEAILPWCLSYGNGLHPFQWLTCNFLHANWMHVIGNMLFLWPFGLLVEGKLGWWRMLLLCLAICILHASVQQVMMLSSNYGNEAAELAAQFAGNPEWEAMSQAERDDVIEGLRQGILENGHGVSLGSSCLVFGLLAVCAVWAPVNEFDVVSRWGAFEWPVLTVAAVFVLKEFLVAALMGGAISTPMLHLFGAVAGFVLGLSMLVIGWVDCEGFDVISTVTGEKFEPWSVQELIPGRIEAEERREAQERAAKEQAEREARRPQWQVARPQAIATPDFIAPSLPPADPLFSSAQAAVASADSWLMPDDLPQVQSPAELLETAVSMGDYSAATGQLAALLRTDREFRPPADTLHRLAEGLIQTKQFGPAKKVLSFGISRYPDRADHWRLRAAQILLVLDKEAAGALELLNKIDRRNLNEASGRKWDELVQAAKSARGPVG